MLIKIQTGLSSQASINPQKLNLNVNILKIGTIGGYAESDLIIFSQIILQMMQQLELQKERLEKLQHAVVAELQLRRAQVCLAKHGFVVRFYRRVFWRAGESPHGV